MLIGQLDLVVTTLVECLEIDAAGVEGRDEAEPVLRDRPEHGTHVLAPEVVGEAGLGDSDMRR